MKQAYYVVLTDSYQAALADWKPKLHDFDQTSMIGLDYQGRLIRFVHVGHVDRLHGIDTVGYEVHPTVYRGRGYEKKQMLDEAIRIIEHGSILRPGSFSSSPLVVEFSSMFHPQHGFPASQNEHRVDLYGPGFDRHAIGNTPAEALLELAHSWACTGG